MSQTPRYPADTPAQRRAAIHAMLDRVLDARPDLDAGLTNVLSAVAKRLANPGAMASMELFGAARRLFESMDKPPPAPPGGGGFRAR